VYIADCDNQRIRKITILTGKISTIAGTGTTSYSGDNGQATAATVNYPYSVAVDSSGIMILRAHGNSVLATLIYFLYSLGNVYIPDYGNHRIRKVTVSTGIITTIAGTGTASYSGDNGAATSATINYAPGAALDASGIDGFRIIQFHSC